MPIKEIEKDLQRDDSKLAEREHGKTVYDVWESKENDDKQQYSNWQRIKEKMFGTRIRAITFGGIVISVIVFLVLATASFVYFQGGFFAQDRVSLFMESPQAIDSNILTGIIFTYENDNRAYLDNVQIAVQFGDYFVPEEEQENFERVSDSQGVITIGKIKGGKKNSTTLAGHFVGPSGAVDDVSGTLRYTPERTSSQYEVQARSTTMITSSPVSIDINSPIEIVSGNLMDIAVVVKNTSTDILSNLKLTFDVPKSFSVYNAQPSATHDNVWLISDIAPQSEEVIHVRGGLEAPIGTAQTFSAEVGTQQSGAEYIVYAQGKYSPRIIGSPIIVHQKIGDNVDDVVYAGDKLRYEITFTNDSDMPLRDVIVVVKFDTETLDFSQLELGDRGSYDAENKKIVWKASDVPELKTLKPKDSGAINFTVPMVNNLPVEDQNDNNFSVTTIASIDSGDIPSELRENKTVLSNVLIVPVGAKVLFNSSAKYKEGIRPLKVGEKVTYTITFTIDNINNDITDTVVSALLPTYISFEGGDSAITFNERTNEVAWDIGDIEHGVGVTSDKLQGAFNVSFVPSIDQIDDMPVLIKQQTLTAKDLFADALVHEIGEKITTFDQEQGYSASTVQP